MSQRHSSQEPLRRRRRALGRAWVELPLRARGLVVTAIPLLALVAAALLLGALGISMLGLAAGVAAMLLFSAGRGAPRRAAGASRRAGRPGRAGARGDPGGSPHDRDGFARAQQRVLAATAGRPWRVSGSATPTDAGWPWRRTRAPWAPAAAW